MKRLRRCEHAFDQATTEVAARLPQAVQNPGSIPIEQLALPNAVRRLNELVYGIIQEGKARMEIRAICFRC
jgi:hypothetical protein